MTTKPMPKLPDRIESLDDLMPSTLDRLWNEFKVWAFKTSHGLLMRSGYAAGQALIIAVEQTADTSTNPHKASERERGGFIRWYSEVYMAKAGTRRRITA